jgi:hypothetical protein
MSRPYPSTAALDLARAGGVADTHDAPQDEHLLTRVSGRVLVYAPGTPFGWVCTCEDFYFGATMRQLEAAAAKAGQPRPSWDPMLRACKHVLALRVVADAEAWEARVLSLRAPLPLRLLGIDPDDLRLVA